MRSVRNALPAVVTVGLLLVTADGAAQIATATLAGAVRDETSGALPGATITVRSAATGAVRTTMTDAGGRYRVAALDPGEYQVRAELASFRAAVRTGVVLVVGGTTEVDIEMSLGAVTEEVTVATQAPLIDSSAVELSRVLTAAEIESLPIAGRNFVDFIKLSSGVAAGRENVGGGAFKEPDVGVGSAAAPRLSFGGQPELNTMVQVDGADNIQAFTGLPRATPSQEAAKEFRVLNSTYLAEYGRALGGFVNIVTKSGGNRVEGSVYYFGMHDALAARSVLNAPDADVLHQNQFGLTFGAPVVASRTFFFGSYEGQVREQSNRFSRVVQTNTGKSNYHGVTFEAERRFAAGFGFHGSYTLSKVRNNVDSLANLADFPEGQDLDDEMALSRQDVRHRFTLTVLTCPPRRRSSEAFASVVSCRSRAGVRSTFSRGAIPTATATRIPIVQG